MAMPVREDDSLYLTVALRIILLSSNVVGGILACHPKEGIRRYVIGVISSSIHMPIHASLWNIITETTSVKLRRTCSY